jgi:hypothetical protein
MASWFWLNVPLMAVFFLATVGIPLWLVLKRPDRAPREQQASAAAKVPAAAEEPAHSQKMHPERELQLTR